MIDMNKIAGISCLLVLAVCLTLVCGMSTAIASEKVSVGAASTDMAGHDGVLAEDTHQAGHVSGSLSAKELKDLGWRIVNFIALMIILVRFLAKPIGDSLAARRKTITEEIEGLEQKRENAEKQYLEFREKLSTAESEIDKIVERALAQAEIERAKIIEKAELAAEEIMRSAEMAVQNEVTNARRTLKNDIADKAAAMAEDLIRENLTAEDQVKIIENYLERVGAAQ
ncbi:MAG: hypothetical protein CSB23_04610 [Deltaproteobacteria bacterium]|nr:MAG: hypothetical protein CSB23_04610 [Deltaproteobacteria bacterium]